MGQTKSKTPESARTIRERRWAFEVLEKEASITRSRRTKGATREIIDLAYWIVDAYEIGVALDSVGVLIEHLKPELGRRYDRSTLGRDWNWYANTTYGKYDDPLPRVLIPILERDDLRQFAERRLNEERDPNSNSVPAPLPSKEQHFVVSQALCLTAIGEDLGLHPQQTVIAMRRIFELLDREHDWDFSVRPGSGMTVTARIAERKKAAAWWKGWVRRSAATVERFVRMDKTFGEDQENMAKTWSFPWRLFDPWELKNPYETVREMVEHYQLQDELFR